MIIPESVTSYIEKGPMDNLYFYKANASWARLTLIANGSIPYISDDYSALINTLERFYKGVLQSKLDNDDSYHLPIGFLTMDHNLRKLADEIEHFLPLFVIHSVSDMRVRNNFLDSLRKAYTTARYTQDFSFEEFKNLYSFIQKQKNAIEQYLQPKIKEVEDHELDL